MDTAPLRDAYRALLDAAAVVAEQGGATAVPQDGEWDADRILAHIALVDAATLATAATIASGSAATYDNRHSHHTWTSRRVTALAGGNAGLRDRIRRQGEALCSLSAVLSDAELDVAVPTLLLSHDEVVLDQPVPLKAILTGLAEDHLPKHTAQLLALPHNGARAAGTT
ncbi:hypothetical protein [Jatrophihabitans lederbergiae]|uniref:DinB-like domain-containing protein n=1 Tax=Jatrophihabitans lederbergiae TaxID=3075547 RepID=A0ABU2JCE5_9ACTN|nr:hypothetical protein [Jatrophihabitans sp. DSM 44399]MDT0262662.1 hypothetical protein [Jatrophihabitans sp. DSM 44399]